MATAAQSIAEPTNPLLWFRQFLKQELSPYPGRGALVARMVLAATIVMILNMVFRIPYGAYGALYALTISRENPQATVNSVKTIVVAFAFSVLYVLVGALFFLADPELRLFWVISTFFVMFYALRVMANYTAAVRFGYLLIVTIPVWDEHISAGLRVEGTLWAFGAISLASIITALMELLFAEFKPRDDLVQPIAERLTGVEELLGCYLTARPVDNGTEKQITHLAMVGTSRLRRILQRSAYSPHYAEQMSAVVALVGRLVDLAANLMQLTFDLSGHDREQIRKVANNIASIRVALQGRRTPTPFDTSDTLHGIPLLRELHTTAALIPTVFTGSQSLSAYTPQPARGDPPSRILVPDALSNPEHIRFALKGCLAASLCYIIYNAKDWPGISTAVTTCFLTALTTVGASHQKQILRIAGAIVGGILVGIGSQVFILPYLDSIAGFTLLFLAVTIPAAWVAISSPRLSYFGVQVIIAFYLINFSEFNVQVSLIPARDRVVGILLGLFMMWLIFDLLWGLPAAVEMKRTFISNLRLLAQLVREPPPGREKTWLSDSFRETIGANFNKVRSLADAVLFEFGSSREQDLALRDRIRRWQPRLHALFLTRIALLKYRLQLPGFELPPPVRVAQQEFDDHLAKVLDDMADRLESKASARKDGLEGSFEGLEKTVRSCCSKAPQELLAPELQTFLALSHSIENVTLSLDREFQ
jgi:multidrug resistance protein MdtO